jgi:hypothetical protein
MTARRQAPREAVDHLATQEVVNRTAATDTYHHGIDVQDFCCTGDRFGRVVGHGPHRNQLKSLPVRRLGRISQRRDPFLIGLPRFRPDKQPGTFFDVQSEITWFCRKFEMKARRIITLCYLCSQGIELLCRRL